MASGAALAAQPSVIRTHGKAMGWEAGRRASLLAAFWVRAGVSRRPQGALCLRRWGLESAPAFEDASRDPAMSILETEARTSRSNQGRERVEGHHRFNSISEALAGFGAHGLRAGGRRRATPASSKFRLLPDQGMGVE